MNWKKKTPLGLNCSEYFCNHSINYLFENDTTPLKIFLDLGYKKLAFKRNHYGASAVGDVKM